MLTLLFHLFDFLFKMQVTVGKKMLRGRIRHTVANKSIKQLKDEPNVSRFALLSLTMANKLKTILSLTADQGTRHTKGGDFNK